MKKNFFFSILAICVGFFSGKAYLLHKQKIKLDASGSTLHRLINVIVLSDDKKVVQSAFSQDYDNFKVLQVTGSYGNFLFQSFSDLRQKNKEFSSILNKLSPDDIVVFIDDNRWFAHDHVLAQINKVYNEKDVLALSCKELSYPSYSIAGKSYKVADMCCFVLKGLLKDEMSFKQGDVAKVDEVLFFKAKKEL